jgi:hypothetical protein
MATNDMRGNQASSLEALQADVWNLCETIGERNTATPGSLAKASDYLYAQLAQSGWRTSRESFEADGETVCNLVAEHPQTSIGDPLVLVGAHYDSVPGSPGADDNASAVALLLGLARCLGQSPAGAAVRLVAFVNEEPPYFHSDQMGSLVHARGCDARCERLTGMICLESLGIFTEEPNSQSYPVSGLGLAYPTTGNFVAFVSNIASRQWLRRVTDAFSHHSDFPIQSAALPEIVTGVSFSDHWSFWQSGYPAMMLTDTAPFRNPNYHLPEDTPEKLNYAAMSEILKGLAGALPELRGK